MAGIHGLLLMATAIIHVLFGLGPKVYGAEWRNFVRSKLWKSVWIDNDKNMAAFWFVIFGPVLFLTGMSVYEIETAGLALPSSIGWTLLGVSTFGAIMCPKSGFTVFLLPQAIFYLCSEF